MNRSNGRGSFAALHESGIGTTRTFADVRSMSAVEDIPDIQRITLKGRDWPKRSFTGPRRAPKPRCDVPRDASRTGAAGRSTENKLMRAVYAES